MKIRTLKAMCFGGVRQEPGTDIEVLDSVARELIVQGRAEPVGALPAQSGPMTTETAASIVDPAKGKANARS